MDSTATAPARMSLAARRLGLTTGVNPELAPSQSAAVHFLYPAVTAHVTAVNTGVFAALLDRFEWTAAPAATSPPRPAPLLWTGPRSASSPAPTRTPAIASSSWSKSAAASTSRPTPSPPPDPRRTPARTRPRSPAPWPSRATDQPATVRERLDQAPETTLNSASSSGSSYTPITQGCPSGPPRGREQRCIIEG